MAAQMMANVQSKHSQLRSIFPSIIILHKHYQIKPILIDRLSFKILKHNMVKVASLAQKLSEFFCKNEDVLLRCI